MFLWMTKWHLFFLSTLIFLFFFAFYCMCVRINVHINKLNYTVLWKSICPLKWFSAFLHILESIQNSEYSVLRIKPSRVVASRDVVWTCHPNWSQLVQRSASFPQPHKSSWEQIGQGTCEAHVHRMPGFITPPLGGPLHVLVIHWSLCTYVFKYRKHTHTHPKKQGSGVLHQLGFSPSLQCRLGPNHILTCYNYKCVVFCNTQDCLEKVIVSILNICYSHFHQQ